MDVREMEFTGDCCLSSDDTSNDNGAIAPSDVSNFVAKSEEPPGLLLMSDMNESVSSQLDSSQAEDNTEDSDTKVTAEDAGRSKRRKNKSDYSSDSSKRSKNTSPNKNSSSKVVSECDEDAMETENCDKEVEEDDLTSKLLSIQELPRIPKRKQQEGNVCETPSAEKSSYRSVLERVETGTSRGMGSFPNWSTSGWKRSNTDNNLEDKSTWSQKGNRVGRSKWSDRANTSWVSEFHGHRNEMNKSKDKVKSSKDTKDSSSSASTANTQSLDFGDSKNRTSVEKTAVPVSVPGPLPTLPFEEQMRERAKLRSLQMADRTEKCAVVNSDEAANSCHSTDHSSNSQQTAFSNAEMNTVCSQENKRISLINHVESHTTPSGDDRHSDKTNGSEAIWNNNQLRHKKSNPSEKHSLPDDRQRNKSHRSNRNGEKTSSTSSLSSITQSASPLPHLPVLPLFAAVCTSDNASSDMDMSKKSVSTTVSVKESSPSHLVADPTGASDVKLVASGSKTVTFNCPEGSDKSGERKGKPKKASDRKLSKVSTKPQYSVFFACRCIHCLVHY
jgi:hypothetical protein